VYVDGHLWLSLQITSEFSLVLTFSLGQLKFFCEGQVVNI